MKKYIITLLTFLNLSCVSSSKYQKLFDETLILEKKINHLENVINNKKNEIHFLNNSLQQNNNKNSLCEENILIH